MSENEAKLATAHTIANELVERGVDLNELGKVLAYLRTAQSWDKALTLMQRLADTGAVRSQQTRRYYQTIHTICQRHIPRETGIKDAGYILGWAVRLARLPRLERLERNAQDFRRRER